MDHRSGDITLELEGIKLLIRPDVGCSIGALDIRNDAGVWAPVLRTMPHDSMESAQAGSFVMVPWTNRIKDAHFRFLGNDHALRANFPDNSAIHGVGRDLPWTIADRSPITARFILDSRSFPQDAVNYPFKFGAVQRFEIGPACVEIDLSITNLDDRPIPVGCGHHPYIHRHIFSDADELRVKIGVGGRYPTQGCIPTGEPIDDSICASLSSGDPIANPGLDDIFSGFEGVAVFDWDASDVRMTMSCSEDLDHLVIYTPRDANGDPDEFVCVEPVSMVNDGFNRHTSNNPDTGVVILEPNSTMRTRMTLAFSSA